MAQFALGTLTVPSATGAQSVTGLGFTPKAVLFFSTVQTAYGHGADLALAVGAAAGPDGVAIGGSDQDAQNRTNTDRAKSPVHCIYWRNPANAIALSAKLQSFDADGFTLNWGAVVADVQVHYLAIGGSEVQAKHGEFACPTATGAQSVTGVGFQPDLVLLLSVRSTNNTTYSTTYSYLSLGAGISSTSRWSVSGASENNLATTNTSRRQEANSVLTLITTNGWISGRADLVSLDADGFTLNWTEVGTTEYVEYLALKGLRVKLGRFLEPSATGNQSVTGVGFQPQALLLVSTGMDQSREAMAEPHHRWGIGLATGPTSRRALWVGSKDANAGSVAKRWSTDTAVLGLWVEDASGSTQDAQADLTSFDPDGFTLSWSAVSTTEVAPVYYLALASDTTVSVSASDSGLLSASESSFVQASFSVFDSSLLSALESPRISLSQPDSGLLSALEEAQVALLLQPSDSGTLTASETWGLTAQVSTGESPLLGSAEAYELALRSQDSHLLSATEAHQVVLSLAETGQLLSQESPGITVRASESALLSATEQSSAGNKFGEDDHVLSATEGASAQALLQVSDSGTIGSVESGAVSMGITAQDSGTVLATESLALEVAASDEGQVRSLEQPQVRPERVTRGLASGELRTTRVETEWGTSRLDGELSASRILMTLEVDP